MSSISFCDDFDFNFPNDNALVVVDSNTVKLFDFSTLNIPVVEIACGDRFKNIDSVEKVVNCAIGSNLDRDAVFFAFGGGMICDLTAFSASVYKRGVKCVLIPTSLLAMVDASVGGKTAINIGKYKNMIGSFYNTDSVCICYNFLTTLPFSEKHSGFAEIFKIGLLFQPKIFTLMVNFQNSLLQGSQDSFKDGKLGLCNELFLNTKLLKDLIELSVNAKLKVVQKDFTEQGCRKFLNLGHTFGHALESVTNFSVFSHGEAVAWGIAQAMKVSKFLNIIDVNYANTVLDLLLLYGWEVNFMPKLLKNNLLKYTGFECSDNVIRDYQNLCEQILLHMKKDKKNKGNKINLVLQKGLNENIVYQIDDEQLITFFISEVNNE